MKILLVNPIYFDPVIYPPVNLAYLAAMLRNAGHKVMIIDTNVEHNCIDRIRAFSPRLIGLPVMSFSEPIVSVFIENIKKIAPSAKIVVGGAHVSIMQEAILAAHPAIDFGIIGEGEYALVELCEALEGKRPYETIDGFLYREGETIKKTALRPFNELLDKLPFPAWDLLPLSRYKFLPIVDSRGCPGQCNFCCVKDVQGRKWRPRSWMNIIEEIDYDINRFGFKKFYIDGDNLLVDKARMISLCSGLEKKKLGIAWVATQGMRADFVTEEILVAMKKSGCISIGFGIESGDDEILRLMQKGETRGQIAHAIRLAKKAGFYVVGCFMVGNIGETAASVERSIDFMKSLDLNDVYINSVTPYPKTALWEWVKQHALNFAEGRCHFPSTLQPNIVDPAFETKEFTKNERISAYKRFRKEAFWSRIRLNIFKRALIGIILKETYARFFSIICHLTGEDPHARILKRCDLWRSVN